MTLKAIAYGVVQCALFTTITHTLGVHGLSFWRWQLAAGLFAMVQFVAMEFHASTHP